MFIGLIFDILLLVFVVVAILLIFSLLLTSVETKAFEFGVMRLVGLTKLGFIAMILTQATIFVLPAVILAFMSSFPVVYLIQKNMLSESLGYMPSIIPTVKAVMNALALGIFIPLASSIMPIKRGLAANLTETLDASRSKTKGAIVSIINNKALNMVPYLIQGTLAVSLGITVYYGLPVAILE